MTLRTLLAAIDQNWPTDSRDQSLVEYNLRGAYRALKRERPRQIGTKDEAAWQEIMVRLFEQ